MCGIAGIFSPRHPVSPTVLDAMNDTVVHRGPDDGATFVDNGLGLAMRRLAIIGVQNGRQPIFSEDRRVVVVLNGEIYNYRALRAGLEDRGHRFATESDVETVVHLYEEHGDGCVDHLRGMFAFALWDRDRRRLLLARDRSGQKPLYYAERDGRLVFGSEIKALHASGLVPKTLDPKALRSYLAYGFVVGTGTLFAGVSKLPAGHLLVADENGVSARRYWELPRTQDATDTFEQAATRIRALLEASVERRLMSEVPLGAFLSGGVDSSAVVALMTRLSPEPIQTFCVGFEDSRFDELAPAREVAAHFGARHHEIRIPGCDLALLREVNHYHDEPAGDPAAVPTLALARFARRHITVALTGEGGDEAFAGYPHHRHCRKLAELEARLPGLSAAARMLGGLEGAFGSARARKALWLAGMPPAERHRGWYAAGTDRELDRLLVSELRGENGLAGPFLALQTRVAHLDPLSQLLYVDAACGLADQLLMKVDKMTMAASLEARCPLLDQDLLEYAATLPASYKLGGGESKRVLRRAFADLVPPEILARPKHGFDVPLDTWLLRDLRGFVDDALLAEQAPLRRMLDGDELRRLWRRFETRRESRDGRRLWRIVNLAVWHELHWPSGLLDALPPVDNERSEISDDLTAATTPA